MLYNCSLSTFHCTCEGQQKCTIYLSTISICVQYLFVYSIYLCTISICVQYLFVYNIYLCTISICVQFIYLFTTSLANEKPLTAAYVLKTRQLTLLLFEHHTVERYCSTMILGKERCFSNAYQPGIWCPQCSSGK